VVANPLQHCIPWFMPDCFDDLVYGLALQDKITTMLITALSMLVLICFRVLFKSIEYFEKI